jgi:MFS family permease
MLPGGQSIARVKGERVQTGVFAPLRDRDFLRLWIGQFVSVIGDKITQIALAILVYEATGSMLQMGIMLGVSALPSFLFGVFAGVCVDRWDRRRTMIAADLVRAALVLTIPFVVGFGIAWVYVIAFGVATVSVLFEPAKRSLIPDLVAHDDLMAANSLDNGSSAVAELVGLAFGGVLMVTIDPRMVFAFDAVTYAVSALAVFLIAYRSPESTEFVCVTPGILLGEAVEGLMHAVRSPVLGPLLAVYCVAAAAIGASITTVNALALRTFDAGAPGLATLDAAIAVGLLGGSYLVGRSGSGAAGLKLLWGLAAFAVSMGVLALAPNMALAAGLLVFSGIANMWAYIPAQSIVQTVPAPSMRGRVISVMTSANRVLFVVGVVGAGALLEQTGTGALLAIIAAVTMCGALLGFVRRPLREA